MRVLVVDDDAAVVAFLTEELSAHHEVVGETSAPAALARALREDFGLVIADARLARPSLEPIVTMASLSGSRVTPNRVWYQLQIARRRRGMPLEVE